jgi:hypothetical protein
VVFQVEVQKCMMYVTVQVYVQLVFYGSG